MYCDNVSVYCANVSQYCAKEPVYDEPEYCANALLIRRHIDKDTFVRVEFWEVETHGNA